MEKLIDQSEQLANDALPELVEQARNAISKEYADERERLASLAQVNPSVRENEVDALSTLENQLLGALDGTHAKPVSVRVMFNS